MYVSQVIVILWLASIVNGLSPLDVLRRLRNSPFRSNRGGSHSEESAKIEKANGFESYKDGLIPVAPSSDHFTRGNEPPSLLNTAWLLLKVGENEQRVVRPATSRPYQPVKEVSLQTNPVYRNYPTVQTVNRNILPERRPQKPAQKQVVSGISDMEDATFLKVPPKPTVSTWSHKSQQWNDGPMHEFTYRLISAPEKSYQSVYNSGLVGEQKANYTQTAPRNYNVTEAPVEKKTSWPDVDLTKLWAVPPRASPEYSAQSNHLPRERKIPDTPSEACLATGRNFCTLEEDFPT